MDSPALAQPNSTLAAALAGAGDSELQKRIAAADEAWYASGGSVVATARTLQQPYTQTLRMLASPACGQIASDDPRVLAHAMAMANIVDGASKVRATPKQEVQVATEKTAMQQLTKTPGSEIARSNLVAVAEAEILRDTRVLQIQQEGAQKSDTKKRDTQER